MRLTIDLKAKQISVTENTSAVKNCTHYIYTTMFKPCAKKHKMFIYKMYALNFLKNVHYKQTNLQSDIWHLLLRI